MTTRLILRLLVPSTVLSLLLLGAGVGAAWRVHRMHRDISHTLELNVSSMRAAEQIELQVREVQLQIYRYLVSGNQNDLEVVQRLRPEIDGWIDEGVEWSTTEYEQELMQQIRRGLNTFFAKLGPEAELKILTDELLENEVLQPAHAYLAFNERELERNISRNTDQAERLSVGLLLLGVCGSMAGLVAGAGIAWGFRRSMVQLSVPLQAAAGQLGEVVGPITFAAPWDLHDLEDALRLIADRVAAAVERLRKSQREALRAEQLAAVGQMAAGIAHELRNPLTAIKILVQAANSSPSQSGLTGRDLTVVEEEITRLEGVIQSFLNIARPPRPEKSLVCAQQLIEESLALVRARASLCHVILHADLPRDSVMLLADAGQIRQVLLNLLLNALDVVPAGGRVMLKLEVVRDRVVLRLRDTGPGLPPQLGERIFTPFVSTKETGLGLGLSISRRIIEWHGGTLEADNLPQGGAEFVVRLPVAEVDVIPKESHHGEAARCR